MTLSHQDEVKWLDSIWNNLAIQIKKENEANPSTITQKIPDEMSLLTEELLGGFHAATEELKKIHVEASIQLHQWVLENRAAIEGLFQLDPLKLAEKPIEFIQFINETIPPKILQYLFYAGQSLYLAQDYHNGQRVFRLLTLLETEKGELQVWLGLCQQAKRLPELALISFTIAAELLPEDPYPYFHTAQCWMMLKRWDEMNQALTQSLNIIGTNPFQYPLKVKCEELQTIIPVISTGKVVVPPPYQAPIPHSPLDAINNLFSGNGKKTKTKELTEEEWHAIQQELEAKLSILASQLKGSFARVENTFGFFERGLIRLSEKGVEIPFETFSVIQRLTALFFLGTLSVGTQISVTNKIVANVFKNAPINAAYRFSSLLDQNNLEVEEEIIKYLYLCDSRRGLVVNQATKNPSYGSEDRPYEQDREKGIVRASHFLKKDIEGKTILDFGCNEGSILFACQKLGSTSMIGLDLSHRCIENAKRRASEENITNIQFFEGDMENSAFLASLPKANTVFLLAILDTSNFVNKTAVLARVSQFAKDVLYYEGHLFTPNQVSKMYELLTTTNFTRFEYLGTYERRPLIRCSRDMIQRDQIPAGAITSDADDADLLNAEEIYLFTDSPRNPPFSTKCKLIQFVKR